MKVTIRISPADSVMLRKGELTILFDTGLLAARTNPALISSVKIPRTRTISTSIDISSSDYYHMRNLGLAARQVIQLGLEQVRHPVSSCPGAGPGHAPGGFEP